MNDNIIKSTNFVDDMIAELEASNFKHIEELKDGRDRAILSLTRILDNKKRSKKISNINLRLLKHSNDLNNLSNQESYFLAIWEEDIKMKNTFFSFLFVILLTLCIGLAIFHVSAAFLGSSLDNNLFFEAIKIIIFFITALWVFGIYCLVYELTHHNSERLIKKVQKEFFKSE